MQYKNRLERHLELNVDGVHAVPNTIKPKLLIRVSAKNDFGYPISVLGMEGGLSLRTPEVELFLGSLYRASGATPPYPLEFYTTTERQDQFVVDLDWETLHEIERYRNGGALKFVAKLQFLCGGLSESGEVQSLFWLQVNVVRNRSGEILVSQQEWIESLNQWKYADLRVLEVNVPREGEGQTIFKSALAHLAQADKQFLKGDYPETLTACRKAADSLKDVMKGYIKSLNGDKRHSLRRDNIESLYNALKGFLSIGPHDGHPANRPEATLALSMSKDFLSFASKLEMPLPQAPASPAEQPSAT